MAIRFWSHSMGFAAALLVVGMLVVGLQGAWMFVSPPPMPPRFGGWQSPAKESSVQKAYSPRNEASTSWVGNCTRAALAMAAALAILLVPMDGAEAARSGGRIGGGARMGGSRARGLPATPRSAPRAMAPRGSGPNISIGVGPMIGSPMYSPFGFGGFGMPLPLVAPLPVPSGPSATDQMLQNQQKQDERVIDQQNAQIEQLQKELAELKAKRQ